MALNKSLDDYINSLVKRYSSLFTLPTQKEIILLLYVVCVASGVLSVLALNFSANGVLFGISVGNGFFFLSILSDLMINKVFMKNDLIFDLRRCGGLTLFSCSMWTGFIFIGTFFSLLLTNSQILVKIFLLGFSAAIILRLVVFFTMSTENNARVFISSCFQPVLWLVLCFYLWPLFGYIVPFTIIMYPALSIPFVIAAVFSFIFLIDQVGKETLNVSTFSLFRAFLANWVEDLNMPLEGFFEKLGNTRDIDISMLAFRVKGEEKFKAILVVPSFHPGPFKNVGSSILPLKIQSTLEQKLDCVVAVPHGLFGHEHNLSSQAQNKRVLKAISKTTEFKPYSQTVTKLVRIKKDIASATCQIFGGCALLTLTLAPNTTEDLPKEIGLSLIGEIKKLGLSAAYIINAHNSIDGVLKENQTTRFLTEAALTALRKAVSQKAARLEMGAAKAVLKSFNIRDGMGQGGITVFVTKVSEQKTGYVVIDGNNMVQGLREKILSKLKDIGIDTGEVLTTDTHVVSGVVMNSRGYHPIGEVMDHATLIKCIEETALKAIHNMEPVETAWHIETVPNVKVMGKMQIKAMSSLAEKAARRAKKATVILFPSIGTLLTLLLFFL